MIHSVSPAPYENPMVCMNPVPLSTMLLPRIHPLKKGVEGDWPERMKMFYVFHKAFRHLRGALFRILSRCTAALKALRPQACPPMVVMDASVDVAGQAFGVMGDWMWHPEPTQEGEGLEDDKKMLEEDKIMNSPKEKSLEDWSSKEMEPEVDLYEWLEWESSEDCPDENDALAEGCAGAVTERRHTISHSGEHSEWDSDSNWSDDNGDDDSDWDEDSGEDSEENSKLWDLFIHNNDPYNPLYFNCPPVMKHSFHQAPEEGAVRPLQPLQPSRAVIEDQQDLEQQPAQTPPAGRKKVQFSDAVKVRRLVVWEFASRAARSGSCWQQMALDRSRFSRRVEEVANIIGPCLEPQHRARVWEMLHLM